MNPDGALERLLPVLDIQRHRLGATDPAVVDLRRQAALLRASCGKTEQAATEIRELAAELGERHPDSSELAEILRRLGA